MGASIPMITWGIVKGGMALTSFVGGAMGGQLASAAGNMAATGNVSLGNQSYDNYSANSLNAAGSMNLGFSTPTYEMPGLGSTMLKDDGGMIGKQNGIQLTRSFAELSEAGNKFLDQQSRAGQRMVSQASNITDSAEFKTARSQAMSGADTQRTGQTTNVSTSISGEQAYNNLQQVQDSLVASGKAETKEDAAALIQARLSMTPEGKNLWDKAVGWFKKDGKASTGSGNGKFLGVGLEGAGTNSKSESGSISTSGTDSSASTDGTSISNGGKKSDSYTEADMAAVDMAFVKQYLEQTNQSNSDLYSKVEGAQKMLSEGEQLVAQSEEARKQSLTTQMSAGPNSLAQLQNLLQEQQQTLTQFEKDGVDWQGEKEAAAKLQSQMQGIEDQFGLRMSDAGAVSDAVDDHTAADAKRLDSDFASKLSGFEQMTAQERQNLTAGDVIRNKNMGFEEYNKNLEATEAQLGKEDDAVRQEVQSAQQEAQALRDAGLWDISRQYDQMSAGDKALFAGILGTSLLNQGVNMIGGKAVAATGTSLVTTAAHHAASNPSSKEAGIIKNALDWAGDKWDKLTSHGKKTAVNMEKLYDAFSSAKKGEVMEFLTDKGFQKEFARVAGREAVEKMATKASIGSVANMTGIGMVVGAGLWASTIYDATQYADTLYTAFQQFQNGEDINLSSFVQGDNPDPLTPANATNTAFEHNATQRTAQEALDRVSNMDNGTAKLFATGQLQNLQNSGLLAYAPNGSGNTVLEELVSQRMTKQEAIESGIVGESDFSDLTAEIPGMLDRRP